MTQELSSANTLYYKIVAPVSGIGIFGVVAVLLFLYPDRIQIHAPSFMSDEEARYLLAGSVFLASMFVVWFSAPLKYVAVEDGLLLVSNYWKDWRIPLTLISSVEKTKWQLGGNRGWRAGPFGQWNAGTVQPIKVALKDDVGFGLSFVFIPITTFWLKTANDNRQLEELRQLAGLQLDGQ
jgi:hypothetical protein